MSPLSKTVIPLSLLLCILTTTIEHTHAGIIRKPKPTTVRVTNVLESHEDLTVHCKSKNDDLGEHKLPYGSSYEFKFRTNIGFWPWRWSSTLFFCDFRWGNTLKWFNIFDGSRDTCGECFYKVHTDGPCFIRSEDLCIHSPWKNE
ncbi:hypothetical protein ACLB2K_050277 [Fragaria x ananassa]